MSDSGNTPRRSHWLVWLVMLCVSGGILFVLVLPAIQPARSGVGPPKSARPLRQIGIALQSYATTYGGWLPAAGATGIVDPARSWQTQLLPYLDRSDLYNAIDFSAPWDSPANSRVFATKLPEFLIPGEPDTPQVAGCATTQQAANSRLLRSDRGGNLDDLARGDGTSATILLGEVGHGLVPWGQPGNSRDPAAGLGMRPDQFGRSHGNFAYFVFASGWMRLIDTSISPHVLELLADPENGAPPFDDY